MKTKRAKRVFLIYFFVVIPGLFYLAQSNIGYFIERRMKKNNIEVESTGAEFSLFSRTVFFERLHVVSPQLGELTCTNLAIKKIGLLSLFAARGFAAEEVSLDTLSIELNFLPDSLMAANKDKGAIDIFVGDWDVAHGSVDLMQKDSSHLTLAFATNSLQYEAGVGANKGEVTVSQLVYDIHQNSSTARVDTIRIDLNTGNLSAQNITWKSQLTKKEYARKYPYQKGRLSLSIPDLIVKGLDLSQMHADKGIQCQRIDIDTCHLLSYKNKRLPFGDKPDQKLIADWIQSAPVKFQIDTVSIVKSTIVHEELFPDASAPGKVSFTNLYATLYHISSMDQKPLVMDAQAVLLGQGKLKAHFELNSSPIPCRVSGELGAMDFAQANSMTIPGVGLEIRSGRLQHLDFAFQYQAQESSGRMNMHYEDLTFRLIDPETRDQSRQQEVSSFLANVFIVRKSNDPNKNNYREGDISFEREAKKSEFAYWWKSVLSGIKSSVGIDRVSS
ncbi:hypothetical protein BFP72_12705 [Reichenbachiella sp. 5M10]|uniref:DUF748 domain-containing protein n=1 Tax=Reichenbachiella sp. 5M10 TaxID=1889772 RepID=UPI000C157854|nr:DUF748 domain-containing protein [Reichenbachiella sp. 5M10]PIB36192.1 hypothetical protein BFP72_12705 [Reichenbachiella sp. 5M10]